MSKTFLYYDKTILLCFQSLCRTFHNDNECFFAFPTTSDRGNELNQRIKNNKTDDHHSDPCIQE